MSDKKNYGDRYDDRYDTMEINLPDEYKVKRTKRKWRKKQIINVIFALFFSIGLSAICIFIFLSGTNTVPEVKNTEKNSSSSQSKLEVESSKKNNSLSKVLSNSEISKANSDVNSSLNNEESSKDSEVTSIDEVSEEKDKEISNEEISTKTDINVSSESSGNNIASQMECSFNEEIIITSELETELESNFESSNLVEEKYADVQSVYYILSDGTETCYPVLEFPASVTVKIVFNEVKNIDARAILNAFNTSGDVEFSDVCLENNIFTATINVGSKSSVSFLEYYAPDNLLCVN